MSEERDDLALERERQRLVNAYRGVFGGEDGRLVLEDFRRRFCVMKPVFMPAADGRMDALQAAVLDGQRSVVLHVEQILSLPVMGDGNVEKPNVEVIKYE